MTKADGTVVRTLWRELAYQLVGTKAFARIAKDDEQAKGFHQWPLASRNSWWCGYNLGRCERLEKQGESR